MEMPDLQKAQEALDRQMEEEKDALKKRGMFCLYVPLPMFISILTLGNQ